MFRATPKHWDTNRRDAERLAAAPALNLHPLGSAYPGVRLTHGGRTRYVLTRAEAVALATAIVDALDHADNATTGD